MSDKSLHCLALDTALSGCSAALLRFEDATQLETPPETLFSIRDDQPNGQAERLVPMIEAAMLRAGMAFADIGLIGVTTGPGAFTGLRIGLAAAQGFALAYDIPIAGVSTLDALAAEYFNIPIPRLINDSLPPALLVCINSKRDPLYVGAYNKNAEGVMPPAEILPDDLFKTFFPTGIQAPNSITLCGDGSDMARVALQAAGIEAVCTTNTHPNPIWVARQAFAKWQSLGEPKTPDFSEAAPLYLREPDVTLSAKTTRQL